MIPACNRFTTPPEKKHVNSFHDLPNELVLMIGKSLGLHEVKSLVHTNRSLYSLLTPLLNQFSLMPQYRITAFYWAAITGNETLVRLLVVKGINFRIKYKKTILSRFIRIRIPIKKNVDKMVDIILEKGSTLIVQETYEYLTPLHKAARYGNNTMLRLLLDIGADLEVNDSRGRTVLHQAVCENNSFAVKLLLEKNAYVDCQDNEGKTPLQSTVCIGNMKIAKLLLQAGADATLEDNGSYNAVDLAGIFDEGRLMMLLLRNVAPSFTFNDKQTALHLAANHGDTKTVIVLLDKGADIEARDHTQSTALHQATGCGHCEVVRLLLERGAEVDSQDNEGLTPLHTLLMGPAAGLVESRKDIFDALLEKGADTNLQDNSGASAIDYIIDSGFVRVFRDHGGLYFLEKLLTRACTNFRTNKTRRTTLHLAAEDASGAFVKNLLDDGADIAEEDIYGWNALHFAAKWPSDYAKIQLLLARGADIAVQTNDGQTATDIAHRHGLLEASLLNGLSVNFRTSKRGSTALHLAAKAGDSRLTEFFLNRGIDINFKDNQGKTALHYAAGAQEVAVVKLLLENGADSTVRDLNGYTPLFDALLRGHISRELTKLLAKRTHTNPQTLEEYRMLRNLAELRGNREALEVLVLDMNNDAIP